MPRSAEEGRPWMVDRIRRLDPIAMLDIGTGCGTYADLFAREFPQAILIGVEAWEPYIERFGLADKYDRLILGDVREIDPLPAVDVVILGDVLEHMSTEDAVKVWDRARAVAKEAVYLSIPIVHYPQGAEEGNPYEVHVVDDYTHEQVLATFDGITSSWTGQVVGVYEARTCAPA